MKKNKLNLFPSSAISGILIFFLACGGNTLEMDTDAGDQEAENDVEGHENIFDIIDAADVRPDADPDIHDNDAPDVDSEVRPDASDVAGEDAEPECTFDDTIEHHSTCYRIRVDVNRNIPGGVDRTRYLFNVTYPEGDYDRRCVLLDEVIVTRMGETTRAGEAFYEETYDAFVLEGGATADELLACEEDSRVDVFSIEYHGISPVGSFTGRCSGSGWGWPKVTLACNTGLEASVFILIDEVDVNPSRMSPNFDFDCIFGNHGEDALTDFSLAEPTWHNLDISSESILLTYPPWTVGEFWHTDPPWEDRVDPETRRPARFVVNANETVSVGNFCSPYDDLSYIQSHLIMPGSHSAGHFTVETHPFYCIIMPPGG